MAKRIDKRSMTYEQWKEARRQFIGSSDVPVICGLVKYKTPHQLWQDKTQPQLVPEGAPSKRMVAGTKLEAVIAEWYAEETGRKVRMDNVIRVHEQEEWAIANLDRIIEAVDDRGRGILECKSTNSHFLRSIGGEIPPAYYAQIQWQLWVTGLKWGALAILVDGYDFRHVEVERNEEFIGTIADVCRKWYMEHIFKGTPPPLEVPDIELLTSVPDKRVEAPQTAQETLDRLRGVRSTIAAAKAEEEALLSEIKGIFGDAELLVAGDRVLATYKTVKRKAYTVKESQYRKLAIKEEDND